MSQTPGHGSAERVGGWQFQREAPDWRVLDSVGAAVWFATDSLVASAALAAGVASAAAAASRAHHPDVDLRASGVQVRVPFEGGWTHDDVGLAQAVSANAAELALTADPTVPQDLTWSIDTLDRPRLVPFWQALLRYDYIDRDGLVDPLHRHPRVWFYEARPRPLRNRFHFDVAVAEDEVVGRVEAARAVEPNGPYDPSAWNVLLADAEGNEVDFVPGGRVADGEELSAWRNPFGGMAFFATPDLLQAVAFAGEAAAICEDAGFPLRIDLRAGGVLLDAGKDQSEDDQWPDEPPGRQARFLEAARRIQAAALERGLDPDVSRLRFWQVGLDAVDIPAVRAFWCAVLGYELDPRPFVTDIVDPRGLGAPMFFQPMSSGDTQRRAQRNRIHLDLVVPFEQVEPRRQAALAAGGTYTRGEGSTIADPEGNEVDIYSSMAPPAQEE